jgi:hypothetical protein
MKSNNLPLSVTLRDLALLRASDVDLSSVLEPSKDNSYEDALRRSLEFAKEARAVIKLANNGSIDSQGERIDEIRTQCEEILSNLTSSEQLVWSTRLVTCLLVTDTSAFLRPKLNKG